MIGILENIYLGYQVAFTPINVFYCFIGVFIGTMIGVLPGIGPSGTIALLLPITFGMPPVSAIIMLAGIYYGSQYGGSTTSILVNMPGEASSVVTTLDGYQMALQGRAGPALGMAAFSSFIAGTVGTILLMIFSELMSGFALRFGPPEYFSLTILAIVILTYLARGSMVKAMIMASLGFALSHVGMDVLTAQYRFTFGIASLSEGVGLIPLVMGLFGISEVLINLDESGGRDIFKSKIRGLFPNKDDWKRSIGPISRGTLLGFFLGILPGGGAVISSFVAYSIEKRLSIHPEKFGTGVIEGVAGPEAANNSATSGAFIPLFTLGIPSNAVIAMLLGALIINGVKPGPFMIQKNPDLFWGVVVSMYMGNVLLLILNLPLIGLWVRMLKVPYPILFPFILFFCVIGSYSINNNIFDVLMMFLFGIIGFLFKKLQYEPAPLIMAFILGPIFENALRQSLLLSKGSPAIFFLRPISASLLIAAMILLASLLFYRTRSLGLRK